jgi:hypothetical protein
VARAAFGRPCDPRGRSPPLGGDLVGDGPYLVLEASDGSTQQDRVPDERDHEGDDRYGRNEPDGQPHEKGSRHDNDGSGAGGSALARQEVLDVPIVLQVEVEVDQVVDREGRPLG